MIGENPAVGSANAQLQRLGLANLDWLVVRDLDLIETATFWKDGPEIETGELRTEDIGTEVFFFPAAAHTEKDGSFTNTQRLLQWHHKAVEPPGDAAASCGSIYHLGRRSGEAAPAPTDARDRPLLDLTWDYPTRRARGEPSAEAVLREINGYRRRTASRCRGYTELQGRRLAPRAAAGSTPASTPTASTRPRGASPAASRLGRAGVGLGLAGQPAHPLQPRLGRPRRQALERAQGASLVGRGAAASGPADDVPDFIGRPAAGLPAARGRAGPGGARRRRSVHHAGRRQGLAVRAGRLRRRPAARRTTSRRSRRCRNALYGAAAQPGRAGVTGAGTTPTTRRRPGTDVFPYVFTTYRLTEHHTAGGMCRWLP